MAYNRDLEPARTELRGLLSQVPDLFEGEPDGWYRNVGRNLLGIRQNMHALPPELQTYLGPIVNRGIDLLHQEAQLGQNNPNQPVTDETRSERANSNIMTLSREMALSFAERIDPVTEHFVSIDDLVAAHPDTLRVCSEQIDGVDFTFIAIRHPITGKEHRLPLPFDGNMRHKGGPSRLLLDIHAGAPISMITSELPWKDLDVVGKGDDETIHHQAYMLGVDPDGVEMTSSNPNDEFDFSDFCNSRDTDQNMVALGNDGLHYSDKAFHAAQTGHIEISGNYRKDKAIYGTDRFVYTDPSTGEKIMLAKQRGLMRLVKNVAEGKALSFGYLPLNYNMDFGIYALHLAKKWSGYIEKGQPEKFGVLVQNMFYLLQQMHQTRESEVNVMELLRRVHSAYPFFDMDAGMNGVVDLARWKSKKLIKQIDREFGWAYSIGSGLVFNRQPNDTVPQAISLEGHEPTQDQISELLEFWPQFLSECREVTSDYNKLHIDSVRRYFYAIDTDAPGEFDDE